MGVIKQGILGGVSGTVGTVVGGSWKGISYLRSKSDSHADANSLKQQIHRTKFKACVELARSILEPVIKPIWNQQAIKMSGYNLFVKKNIQAFNSDGLVDDYANLQFSIGTLPNPFDVEVTDDETVTNGITVTWTDNSGTGDATADDQLQILAISSTEMALMQDLTAKRSDGTASVTLPLDIGDTINVYAFFKNEELNEYSDSVYGSLVLS